METFPTKLPKEIQSKFVSAYNEYEERKSLESKFVKIVDIIEAEFFCFNNDIYLKTGQKIITSQRDSITT